MESWLDQDYPVQLVGVGKSQHMTSLSNWTNSNDAPVCADSQSLSYPIWDDWAANQRDLFILDHEGNVAFQGNISGGLPSNLNSLVMELVSGISDCDPNLMCGEAITCCDGVLYPTTCCAENCDAPIGDCEEPVCEDGEINNDNPCNPMECWDGQWIEIIIDCAEQMGVPCEGGLYIPPQEGVCCSDCVQFGDGNNDGILNVLDVVNMVNYVLEGQYNEVSDMNSDLVLNVLDIVALVNVILN